MPCYFTYKQQNLVRNGIMKKVYVGDTLNMAKNQNNFIAQELTECYRSSSPGPPCNLPSGLK